jgi:hypothetical protein
LTILDLNNAISFQNKDIEWKISENIKTYYSSGKLKKHKHTEDLHHSLPEVMMGIEIGKMFVDNRLDFRDNNCDIEFSKLADNVEGIAIKCWHSIDKKNKLAQELRTKTLYNVVQDVYCKIDDTKLFELKEYNSKTPLKKQKVSCATKLPARLSSGNVKTLKNDQHMTANIYSIPKKTMPAFDQKKDKIVDDYLKKITSVNEVNKLRDAKSLYLKESYNIKNNSGVESYFDEKIKLALLKQRKDLFAKKTVAGSRHHF